ncbi:PAS domain S-box protein, partial [Candidatus Bipolaricaulota bacterium]|nr:PAS domain S-box protein [Candidatus Bipolaricaulota bacterium]
MAPEEKNSSGSMGFENQLNPRTPKGKPWSILLGLPNEKDEELLSRQLKQLGIEFDLKTLTEGNGEVLPGPFDIAVLDESRISGRLSRQLKEVKKSQEPLFSPVMALIATEMKDKFLERYGEVLDEFLTKPLKRETLSTRLRNLLHLRYLSEELSEKHRAITQNASELISIIDEEGNYLYANKSHQRLLGHNPDDLVGKQALDIIPEEEEQAVRDEVGDLLEKVEKGKIDIGEAHGRKEYIVTDEEGNDRWLESVLTPLSEVDGTKRFLVIARDITARRKQQKKLRKYRDIIEVVDFPVMFQDLDEKYVIANDAVAEYADIPKNELSGKDEGS